MSESPELLHPSRRALLRTGALAVSGAVAAPFAFAHRPDAAQPASSFAHLLEGPSRISLFLDPEGEQPLQRSGNSWSGAGCTVSVERTAGSTTLSLAAPSRRVARVRVRWQAALPAERLRVLGDAWERSYGELGWREVVPERPLPWYFLTFDGERTHGYGVRVGASAFAFWQCDSEGISLWFDIRNGGSAISLGSRELTLATIVTREGASGESPVEAARRLCRQMCPRPRPAGPVYGSNDWYYAYGNSSAEDILRDADLVAELAPARGPRPFTVADEGWANRQKFPDLPGLAAAIQKKSVRPGIWIRPLRTGKATDAALLLPGKRFASERERASNQSLDPTIPEALEQALTNVRDARAWGFELIKHDFSTYDLLGQWGSAMGASPALPGWSFHDQSRTSAEIIRDFYEAIRREAGDAVVIGCNTVGHLGAGIFEGQRIGDDVSGKEWERTRRMGVNTLAFRLPQHGAFFSADPDCIPFTANIPWSLTKQWLDVVSRSGAATVISPERASIGKEQKDAIRRAFAVAAAGGAGGEPVDGLESHTPGEWKSGSGADHYAWLEPDGATPFNV